METFVREVTSLSHIKHPNLVSLLGHYDGPNECFLVYELCHNGNLSEWLFGIFFSLWTFLLSFDLNYTVSWFLHTNWAGKSKYLSWRQRLEIALDCARSLLFLHSYPQGSIVHRDIKVKSYFTSIICSPFSKYSKLCFTFLVKFAASKHSSICQLWSQTLRLWFVQNY